MKSTQFNEIVVDQLDRVQATLVNKGGEYATEADRLHNFVQAAAMQGITTREALSGMMIKHTVSIYDMIGGPTGGFTTEQWDEKITDHITYLVLLKAIIVEEESAKQAAAYAAGFPSVKAQEQSEHLKSISEPLKAEALAKTDKFESNVKFQEIEKSPFEDPKQIYESTGPTDTLH